MRASTWTPRLAVREGFATAWTGRWNSMLVVAALAWLCAFSGAADAMSVSQLVREEQEWIDAGAYVMRVQGAEHDSIVNPLSSAHCDALAEMDGITGTFWAARDPGSAHFRHLPGGEFSVVHVSPAAATFLGESDAGGAVALVTSGLAARTGVVEGDPVHVDMRGGVTVHDPLRVRVADASVLGGDFDGALLLPDSTRSIADMCFVRSDAGHIGAVSDLLPTALAWDGRDAVASPRLVRGEFSRDFGTAYDERPFRWSWLLGGSLAGLLWALIQWSRRSHTAIYATFGARKDARVLIEVSEWGCLALLGALWGWALGVAFALAQGAHAREVLTHVTGQTLMTCVAASIAVVVVALRPTGSLLDNLKDR